MQQFQLELRGLIYNHLCEQEHLVGIWWVIMSNPFQNKSDIKTDINTLTFKLKVKEDD